MSLMVGSLIVLPLAATFWMTQRWMDGRTGSGFWYRHAAIAVVAFILSNVVWQYGFLTPTGINAETRETLMADVKRYQSSQMTTKQVFFLTNQIPSFGGEQQYLHDALLLDQDAWLSIVRSINVVVDEVTSPNARDSLPRHLHVATVILRSILTS